MDVHAVVTVGSLTVEAHVEDCGPDALSDAFRQVTVHTMTLMGGTEALVAAAATPRLADDEGDDD